MKQIILKDYLSDWTDIDFAAFGLARCIGLMSPGVSFQTDAKHVFWSDNQIGNVLFKMLDGLVAADILEKRDEPDYQYRWNPTFKGTWEK